MNVKHWKKILTAGGAAMALALVQLGSANASEALTAGSYVVADDGIGALDCTARMVSAGPSERRSSTARERCSTRRTISQSRH